MCTCIFLGSSEPFKMGPPSAGSYIAPGEIGYPIPALVGSRYVVMLRDWREENPYCSCVFIEHSLPWEPQQESQQTNIAFGVLRKIAEEHGGDLRIFACDDVDAILKPNVFCKAAPKHLRVGRQWFNIPFKGGEVPRILVEIDPHLNEPIKPETLDVL